MNRYVTPDLYKKVREETDLKQDWECELKEEWFGAKQDISHTKIARDMSSEFGCRTGDCESCLGTLKSFKNLTDKRKTRYRDAKRKMPKSFRAEKVEVGCCSGHWTILNSLNIINKIFREILNEILSQDLKENGDTHTINLWDYLLNFELRGQNEKSVVLQQRIKLLILSNDENLC